MILVVDCGNTNVKAIVYDDKKEVYFKAVFTEKENYGDYYLDFFKEVKEKFPKIEDFIFSSVVPSISDDVYAVLKKLYKKDGFVVSVNNIKNLKIKYAHPEEIGSDLLAITCGSLAKYKAPIIMCDLGTATKIMVINENEEFMGGLILPGVTVSNYAMQQIIPHLPKVELAVPGNLMNDDTVGCLQAGLMYGTIYEVKGLVEALENELGFKATKVLTGGYGKFIKDKMDDYIYDEYLGSEGLLEIYNNYRK